jgi:hypothetical protein
MDIMIEYLCQEFESIFKDGSGAMMVSRVKTHKYIGMTLDYIVHGQVKLSMFDYMCRSGSDRGADMASMS